MPASSSPGRSRPPPRTLARHRATSGPRSSAQRASATSQRQDGREQIERTTRTFRGGQELQLANVSGDIVITRGGGNEIGVEIVKTARGRDDADAKELLQLVEVEVVERNNRAEVRTRYPQGDEMRRNNRRNVNVSVAYNVTAPAGARDPRHVHLRHRSRPGTSGATCRRNR